MQALIVIGVRFEKTGKVVENIYTGLDGVAMEAAAKKAAASEKYTEIQKFINPSGSPMPNKDYEIIRTTPVFPRPKALEAPVKQSSPLDKIADAALKLRQDELSKKPKLEINPPINKASEDKKEAARPKNEAGLYLDGPEFEEWVAKGYDPKKYPPQGYAEKPSAGLDLFRSTENKKTENKNETA